MSQDPDKAPEPGSNEKELRARIKKLSRARMWTFLGALAAAASSANRYLGTTSPDWHVLPTWFGVAAAASVIVGFLVLSNQIEALEARLAPPTVGEPAAERRPGRLIDLFGRLRAMVNRLLPTRRARILAATLAIGGGLGVYLAVSSYLTFQNRLTRCEERYSEKGQRLLAGVHNHCAHEVAQLWAMPAYCDTFRATKGGPSRAELRASCRREVAELTGDLELCRKSGDDSETDRCLRTLALRAEDAALCARIPDAESADLCLAEVAIGAMRSELCQQLQDEGGRGHCIAEIVKHGGDMAACAPIRDPQERDACYLAASVANPGACRKITAERRAECLKRHPETLDDLDAACEGRAQCLVTLASATGSAAPCGLISDAEAVLRVQCFADAFARRPWTRDSECARLPTARLRDACFLGLSRLDEHAGACLEVLDPEMRKECIGAAGKSDASRCLALNVAADAASCVSESSLGTTIDPSVCRLLPKPRRQECLEQVASNLEEEVVNAR